MTYASKWAAIAKITTPSLVKARCELENGVYNEGAIYIEIPEMGFFDPDLIYCRYGLSMPYIRVQDGWLLWVEATVDDEERWVYTGIRDCGGVLTPVDADQMFIQLGSQVIYGSTAGVLYLSNETASEPFVLGTQLNTENQKVKSLLTNLLAVINGAVITEAGAGAESALQAALKAALTTNSAPAYGTAQLSTKIKGE